MRFENDSVLRRACCRKGAVLYNYRGSITRESANGENLGVWMLLTFSKRSPPPSPKNLSSNVGGNDGLPAEGQGAMG